VGPAVGNHASIAEAGGAQQVGVLVGRAFPVRRDDEHFQVEHFRQVFAAVVGHDTFDDQ
jgi:hypothetical protein